LIEHELEGFGIRLNKKPPKIAFKKKDKGGINFTSSVQVGNAFEGGCWWSRGRGCVLCV
jgi:ribosome-interacting GTPase 1